MSAWCNKNTMHWMTLTTNNLFLTVLETGKSKIMALADSVSEYPLPGSYMTVCSLYPHKIEGTRVLSGSSLIGAQCHLWGLHPHDLITSQKPHLLLSSHWGLGLSIWMLGKIAPWKKSYDQPRQCIKKQRHYFANKCPSSQSYGFSSSHALMWELDHKEGCVQKNWWFWRSVGGVGEDSWESLGQQGDPTSQP